MLGPILPMNHSFFLPTATRLDETFTKFFIEADDGNQGIF